MLEPISKRLAFILNKEKEELESIKTGNRSELLRLYSELNAFGLIEDDDDDFTFFPFWGALCIIDKRIEVGGLQATLSNGQNYSLLF